MAKPALYNIPAYEGDTLEEEFTLTDKTGAPIDLSTAAVKLTVKLNLGDPDPAVLEMTEGDGITVTGAGNNIVIIDKMINIPDGMYNYHLRATFGSGKVSTFLYGKFTVQGSV